MNAFRLSNPRRCLHGRVVGLVACTEVWGPKLWVRSLSRGACITYSSAIACNSPVIIPDNSFNCLREVKHLVSKQFHKKETRSRHCILWAICQIPAYNLSHAFLAFPILEMNSTRAWEEKMGRDIGLQTSTAQHEGGTPCRIHEPRRVANRKRPGEYCPSAMADSTVPTVPPQAVSE